MTMRLGGARGFGVTSKGESIVEPVAAARARARREQVREMAERNKASQDALKSTVPAGSRAGTHKVEEPLNLGTRDALIEDGKGENDYIPDNEAKGYHVGLVRQPVSQVADARGNVVGFESEHESKFASQPTIHDLKAYHNKIEQSKDWQAGNVDATPGLSQAEADAASGKATADKA